MESNQQLFQLVLYDYLVRKDRIQKIVGIPGIPDDKKERDKLIEPLFKRYLAAIDDQSGAATKNFMVSNQAKAAGEALTNALPTGNPERHVAGQELDIWEHVHPDERGLETHPIVLGAVNTQSLTGIAQLGQPSSQETHVDDPDVFGAGFAEATQLFLQDLSAAGYPALGSGISGTTQIPSMNATSNLERQGSSNANQFMDRQRLEIGNNLIDKQEVEKTVIYRKRLSYVHVNISNGARFRIPKAIASHFPKIIGGIEQLWILEDSNGKKWQIRCVEEGFF